MRPRVKSYGLNSTSDSVTHKQLNLAGDKFFLMLDTDKYDLQDLQVLH